MKLFKLFLLVLIFFAISIFAFLYIIFTVREDSRIANKISRVNFKEEKISRIISGEWDVVCPIGGYSRPSAVITEAGFADAKYSGSGNSETQILSDDESGVIVINIKSKLYAIFLLSYYDKISLMPEIGRGEFAPCFSFEKTELTKVILPIEGWLHLKLQESN